MLCLCASSNLSARIVLAAVSASNPSEVRLYALDQSLQLVQGPEDVASIVVRDPEKIMKKVLIGTLIGAASVAVFAASMNSGLNPGESVTPFHPNHVSGPLANTTNCFPCTFQNRPQVQVWVNGDDLKNIAPIAKTLNTAMGANRITL